MNYPRQMLLPPSHNVVSACVYHASLLSLAFKAEQILLASHSSPAICEAGLTGWISLPACCSRWKCSMQ
jgi:hypothetical protein